ncbi:MAG: M15 family metallopeptidase [Patescibacteria group bacterium]|nr:M15 family metallopeptidase [Patescibacteria group bacterium]
MSIDTSLYINNPIPNLADTTKNKQGYRQHPIDSTHNLYSEAFADIREYGLIGDNFYHRTDNPPYFEQIPHSIPDLLLRLSVIQRLQLVDNELKKSNLELYFFDCYRPIEVQNYFHDVWVPNRLKSDHPDWSESKVLDETEKYWAKGAPSSNEVDPNSPPPHSTSAACDLTIRKNSGEHLFMGGIFDDASDISNTDFFEIESQKRTLTFSEIEALQNRRLLYHLMTNTGFANNPTEWWHYSYGDQMWAKLSNQPTAFYSKIIF